MDDAAETLALLGSARPSWVVLDGYHFLSEYQRRIRDAGFHLLFIDDYGHAPPYSADIVLNQNISADPSLYREREPYTKLLLGTRYVLLRREFREFPTSGRGMPDPARNVLVTFGGGDTENITGRVIGAIENSTLPDIDLTVVVGFSNRHTKELESMAGGPGRPVTIVRGATNMAGLMARAHIAITGGGSTCWELIFMGIPSIVVQLAANQRPIADELGRMGAVMNLGDSRDLDPLTLSGSLEHMVHDYRAYYERSQGMRSLVDGRGAVRVTTAIRHLQGEPA